MSRLALKTLTKMLRKEFAANNYLTLLFDLSIEANSVDPDQTPCIVAI